MKSMTGFGSASLKLKTLKIFVSVKSLNSRFMDIKCYTPAFYYSLESEMQKSISKLCSRGQFVVRVNRFPEAPLPHLSLQWDQKQAKKWNDLHKAISQDLKIKNSVDVASIINQPGVVNVIKTSISLSSQEKTQFLKTFQQALNNCFKERAREGAALKKDILKLIKLVETDLLKIKKINTAQQKRRQKEASTKTESGYGLEKGDAHEEIIRMAEHLQHFKSISRASQAVGKRMDFYIQEIVREINTIGSKSQVSSLTRIVVEIKSNLERLKEQVQNIE